jgi:hypothetical protein
MTVERAQIDRTARPTARAEHVEPRRSGQQRGPDCWRQGFATVRRKRVDIGGREKMMTWLQITPFGQSAIAESKM